jgi:branched-subunit amino acid transport protein
VEGARMNMLWIGVIGSSISLFVLRYLGYLVPEKFLTSPRMLRINTLIPIALLSALVGVQTITEKGRWVIDQRFAGVLVALIALRLKAPYFVVVISAAATSAAIYRFK